MERTQTRTFLRQIVVFLVVLFSTTGVQCLLLSLDRSTSRTLLFNIASDTTCDEKIIKEYKASLEEPWVQPPRVRNHFINPCAFYIMNLKTDSQYYVRVRDNETYSNDLSAWTCSHKAPSVTNLRVADAGPGWIDIRWTEPKEMCRSRYYYDVRYKSSADGTYSPQMRFGYYLTSKDKAIAGPTHPCDPLQKEFCLLLTDRVRPGENHTIEIVSERIGELEGDVSETQTIEAYANPENTGLPDERKCDHINKANGTGNNNNILEKDLDNYGFFVPVWLAAVSGLFYIVALISISALFLKLRFSEYDEEEKKLERQSGVPYYAEEVRYVDLKNMKLTPTGNKIDENEDDIYEEIFIPYSSELK